MKKTILFRADGNSISGLGHIYRLFSLVEIVKEKYDFIFITRESTPQSVFSNITQPYLIPDSVLICEEPKWLSENFDPQKHIIIADGYQFKSIYQKNIKEFGYGLVYIDDLEQYFMYADLVINHSSSSEASNFKTESYTKFALGTKYSLLRPSFLKEAQSKREIDQIDTVFVCFGGADEFDFSYQVVKNLLKINYIKEINLVIGAAYKHDRVFDLKKAFSSKLKIHENLSEKHLLKVMKSCNFAISPTSTILYELTCVKMPIISGYFVDNQKDVYTWFKKQECFYGVDNFSNFNFKKIEEILSKIDNACINKYMINQGKVIDGLQKDRILSLINELIS
ncbi:MAG: UDP-2,4-diacetamido-2,4,6-trideoxy-beta-L-altropyranose hydrolase [Flavobacteriaceae bacterium]